MKEKSTFLLNLKGVYMDNYVVILEPYSARQYVLIYDKNTDIFYTAKRYGERNHSKRKDTILVYIQFFLAAAITVLLYVFFSRYVAPVWNVYLYASLLLLTIVGTLFYYKKDITKLNFSLQPCQYQNVQLTLADNLSTWKQRRKYFSLLQKNRKLPKIVLCMGIMLAICIFCIAYVINHYRTEAVLSSLGALFLFTYGLCWQIDDRKNNSALNYLLQKFTCEPTEDCSLENSTHLANESLPEDICKDTELQDVIVLPVPPYKKALFADALIYVPHKDAFYEADKKLDGPRQIIHSNYVLLFIIVLLLLAAFLDKSQRRLYIVTHLWSIYTFVALVVITALIARTTIRWINKRMQSNMNINNYDPAEFIEINTLQSLAQRKELLASFEIRKKHIIGAAFLILELLLFLGASLFLLFIEYHTLYLFIVLFLLFIGIIFVYYLFNDVYIKCGKSLAQKIVDKY